MKNLFLLSEEEKNRILNLHILATKQQYLKEQNTTTGDVEKYKKIFQDAISKIPQGLDLKNINQQDLTKMLTDTGITNQLSTSGKKPEEMKKIIDDTLKASGVDLTKINTSELINSKGITNDDANKKTETTTPAPSEFLITKNDRAYDYKKVGDKIYFKGKEGTTDKKAQKYTNWTEPTDDGAIKAINLLFQNKPTGDTPSQVVSNTTNPPVDKTTTEVKPEDKTTTEVKPEDKKDVSAGQNEGGVAFSSNPVDDSELV
jgi:hypothetical protein